MAFQILFSLYSFLLTFLLLFCFLFLYEMCIFSPITFPTSRCLNVIWIISHQSYSECMKSWDLFHLLPHESHRGDLCHTTIRRTFQMFQRQFSWRPWCWTSEAEEMDPLPCPQKGNTRCILTLLKSMDKTIFYSSKDSVNVTECYKDFDLNSGQSSAVFFKPFVLISLVSDHRW